MKLEEMGVVLAEAVVAAGHHDPIRDHDPHQVERATLVRGGALP